MRFSKGKRLCLILIVTTFLIIVLKSLVFSDVRSPWLPARLVKDSDVRSPWLSARLENDSDVRSPRLPNRRVFSGHDNRIKVKDAGQATEHVILAARRPWFVRSTQVDFSTCEFSACTLTYNLSDLARASAVVFDALSLSHTLPPPPPRRPQQLWALFFLEPPPVLEAQDPTFQSSQWRGVFNLSMSYRFVLSFENSFCRDYVTEKVFALYNNLHVLPVVRGGADYSRTLPSGTYVDAGDFPSPEALARHLLDLERDHVTYAQMLERKSWYQAESWQWVWPFPWCQLCRMLHENKTSSGVVRTYPDIAAWISHHTCWPAPDLP